VPARLDIRARLSVDWRNRLAATGKEERFMQQIRWRSTIGLGLVATALLGGECGYVIFASIGPSGIAFLGDEDKIAATGKQRIADIHE
jgi:hypothetical protein